MSGKRPNYISQYIIKITENSNTIELQIEGELTIYLWLILTALTTFIPTVSYMILLLFMILAKQFLEIFKFVMMKFLNLTTQYDPARNPKDFIPFAMFGSVLGVMLVTLKVIVVLFQVIV